MLKDSLSAHAPSTTLSFHTMRAVLQRVKGASVHVDGQLVSRINTGILALIGISTEDTMAEVQVLANKVLSLKLWNEGSRAEDIPIPPYSPWGAVASGSSTIAEGAAHSPTTAPPAEAESRKEAVWGGKPWKSSVLEIGGEIACVSQFTLYGRTAKGTKPDFHKAMGGPAARELYDAFLEALRKGYVEHLQKGQPQGKAAKAAAAAGASAENGVKSPVDIGRERIKDGAFGEMMDVSLINDGPVTLIIDTSDSRKGGTSTPSQTQAAAT